MRRKAERGERIRSLSHIWQRIVKFVVDNRPIKASLRANGYLSSFQAHVEASSGETETGGGVCRICKTELKFENDRSLAKLCQKGTDTISAFSRK